MCKNKTSVVFTGDIGFSRYMAGKWEDEKLLSDKILKFCESADHVVANVEGAMVDPGSINYSSSRGIFFHFMDSASISVLKKIRADIWDIANNHIMDMGDEGLKSTIKYAESMGSQAFGAGTNLDEASKPVFLDEAGGIGIIAVGFSSECPPATDTKCGVFTNRELLLIEQRIKEIKKKCRWCVVVSHDGEEFTNLPNPYTRNRYLKYLEFGADIVVAHHPHVVMNYERFPKKAIFYSLGNFIFDTDYQRAQHNTESGVLLKINFTQENFTFDALGTKIVRGDERVVEAEPPAIFADVQNDEYEKLLPLSAKAFVIAEKKRNVFMDPQKFENFTQKQWEEFLLSTDREDFVSGVTMDFSVVLPISEKAEEGVWKESTLESVKEYICKQI